LTDDGWAVAPAPTASPLAALRGLWVAPYGSHGLEIIHLHRAAEGDEAAEGAQAGPIKGALLGLKVVGDANVPAGHLSFAVEPQRLDPARMLALDQRLVVAFPASGAVITHLAQRSAGIAAWYRGRGQINRVPGQWAPDWVGVDFLVYHSGSTVGFSVLWDEKGEAIRHIIDFTPLKLE
jgi:hypothetical protein